MQNHSEPQSPSAARDDHAVSTAISALCHDFHRDGVVVVRGVVTGALLDDLRQRAATLRARAERDMPTGIRIAPGQREACAAAPADRRGGFTWGINEITRQGWHDPALVAVMAHPPIATVLAALLDQPRAWGLKMLWAPRVCDYVLNWHRDISADLGVLLPYKPAANDHVQFNLALFTDPSFRVVPGSHRRELSAHEELIRRTDPCGPIPGERQIMLAPGDVVMMDAHALHRGGVPAGHERLTLHFSCQAQRIPLRPWISGAAWEWLTSDAFLATLSAAAQLPYSRLRTAVRDHHHQYTYLVDQAVRAGWCPPPDWRLAEQTFAPE